MDVPTFWTRVRDEARSPDGRSVVVSAWGWSNESDDDAARRARDTVARMAARVRRGEPFPERYAYGGHPMREERLRELPGRDGRTAVVLTRNAYGAVVLNADDALFVDVDDPPPRPAPRQGGLLVRLLRALLGGHAEGSPSSAASPSGGSAADDAMVARVRAVAGSRGLAMRVYRTSGGYRILCTNRRFDPTSDEVRELMAALDADPKYVQLCRAQRCFRARLTPKPWRMNLVPPPRRDPWSTPGKEDAMKSWLATYDRESAGHAVCRAVAQVGPDVVDPDVAPVLALHDDFTGVERGAALPLA